MAIVEIGLEGTLWESEGKYKEKDLDFGWKNYERLFFGMNGWLDGFSGVSGLAV